MTTLSGDEVVVDSNIARAIDKAARGKPLQTGEQLMVDYARNEGIVVTDRTVGELSVRGGVGDTLNVGQQIPVGGAESNSITRILEGANVGGGAADRQIVLQALLTQTQGGAAPLFATADRGIINGLARLGGIRPDRLGQYRTIAEYLHYVRNTDRFEVIFNGRRLIVRPVQPVRPGL
ncbi:MAG: hypothetical protein IPM82_12070 [Saprospiraceae bacterium]|nr:hypothetical protein [Saprospiraceae bacterium]